MSPILPAFLPGLTLAVAIGLLVGFERGWQLRDEPPGQRVAGIRTFAVLGLFGGLLGIVGDRPVALLSAAGAVIALLVGHAFDMRQTRVVSATGAIAAMLTLLLGTAATSGKMVLASIGAALLVALLAGRKSLHALIRASNEDEVHTLVRLVLMALLVLPLLPDAGLGPYASLNPRRLWFVVVIVGALSFAGYVLQRWLGRARGGLLTAAVGATISSTAVTVACARQLRDAPGITSQAGIALGSTIMVARTLALVAVLAPFVLRDIVWLIVPALIFSAAATAALLFAARREASTLEAQPTRLPGFKLAFLFAGLVALLSLAAAAASHALGHHAGSATIALGGMVDVDSAIAAIGALPPGMLPSPLAAMAIAVPVAFNSLLKLALTLSIAGKRRGDWAAASLAGTAAFVLAALATRLL
ncbi:hypothetical protein COC42_11920 [Sphingomonas spermidinifaciens]|uniref:Uncharacterized protein n=1 Tax=Sphingomonas spermidinifaciens TaxID=1141889 RepID=A0A2A4B279_9SPHN|nr:MgtC/SapB family protein [Sphingomonas spermidinifaciens]PCD02167.1 hypothetical protein COC42_11920 [Sphingomonas spermidinifaciens]